MLQRDIKKMRSWTAECMMRWQPMIGGGKSRRVLILICLLVEFTSKYWLAEYFTVNGIKCQLVQRYHRSMFHQTRRTCRGSRVISKDGWFIPWLEVPARIQVASNHNMQLSCLGTSQSQNSNVLKRKSRGLGILSISPAHEICTESSGRSRKKWCCDYL